MKLDSNNLKLFVGKIKLKNVIKESLKVNQLTSITMKLGTKLKLFDLVSQINLKFVSYSNEYNYNVVIGLSEQDINNVNIKVKAPSIYFVLNKCFTISKKSDRLLNFNIIYFLSRMKLMDKFINVSSWKSICKSIRCSLFSKKICIVF